MERTKKGIIKRMKIWIVILNYTTCAGVFSSKEKAEMFQKKTEEAFNKKRMKYPAFPHVVVGIKECMLDEELIET